MTSQLHPNGQLKARVGGSVLPNGKPTAWLSMQDAAGHELVIFADNAEQFRPIAEAINEALQDKPTFKIVGLMVGGLGS